MKKVISALALFYCIFLGTEYLFDNMMMTVAGAEEVVLAQNYILGISVAGFLLFPLVSRLIREKGGFLYITGFVVTVVGIVCIFLIQQHLSYKMLMISGGVLFFILGLLGSAVHYMTAKCMGKSLYLARTVGTAYALGIFLQFLNNNLIKNDVLEAVVLTVFLTAFVILLLRWKAQETLAIDGMGKDQIEDRYLVRNRGVAACMLILIVALMACIFASLDNAVTLVHAAGEVDVGQWPRLLLALSGLAAGCAFDWKQRKYMSLLMYCVTLLSTACVVIIEFGGEFLIGLAAFYLSSGFFVVYFTTEFIELSRYMKLPKLWAGLGRAVNNFCAVVTSATSVFLLVSQNTITMIISALVLFMLISITTYIYNAQFVPVMPEKEDTVAIPATVDEAARFDAFAQMFTLTAREQDVLCVLLDSDEGVQQIADQLFISRAALYRHMASLNEKTGTKSRIGLLQFYYNWEMQLPVETSTEEKE